MDWLLEQVAKWMLKAILATFNALVDLIAGTLLITPDVTDLPQLKALTGRSVWVVDTVFVLAFVAAGVLTMVAGGNERARYTAKDLLPRLVVGFVAAHFSTPLISAAISLANAVTVAVSGDQVDDKTAFDTMRANVAAAGNDQSVIVLSLVIVGIIAALVAMTLFGFLTRIAVLIVLAAAAPLALACHALPQTEPVAHLWWRSLAGCLATPLLQALALQAGSWMLLDGRQQVLPGWPMTTFMNLFVVVVLLWVTVKIPGLVRRFVSQGGRSPNFLGMIVRVVVVQQLTRALPGAGRLARGARAVAR